MRLSVYLLASLVLLIVQTSVTSLRPRIQQTITPIIDAISGQILQKQLSEQCDYGSFNYALLAWVALTLAFGCALTFSVRNTPSTFNESKWIGFSIYNWTFVGIVIQAISLFITANSEVVFVSEVLMVLITQTGVVGFLFVPKLYAIFMNEGNVINTGFAAHTAPKPTAGSARSSNQSINATPTAGNSRKGSLAPNTTSNDRLHFK